MGRGTLTATQARTKVDMVDSRRALPLTAAAVRAAGALHKMWEAMADKAVAPWVAPADRRPVALVALVALVVLVVLVDKAAVALPARMRA